MRGFFCSWHRRESHINDRMANSFVASLLNVVRLMNSSWSAAEAAITGRRSDYTTEPLRRAVILLALPTALELLMESLLAVVDVFWLSRLGRDAVAVAGLTESVMALIYAVAIGISYAASASIARRIGEGDPEGAAKAAGQVLILGLSVSALLGLLLGYHAPEILRLMGASDSAVELGSDFAVIMLGGNTTVFMISIINAIFRGAGDPFLAMRTLWIANAVNMALAPCLIFGWSFFPELGVTGAAVATTIGRAVGLVYQFRHLGGERSRVRLRWRHMCPDPRTLIAIAKTSSTGIAQVLISVTSWICLFRILASFGSAALAGYTIAMRIVMFALLPSYSLASAGATLVGQNLGARRPDRAETAVRIAARLNVLLLSTVGVVLALLAAPVVRLFTNDPEVVNYAIQALRLISISFPLYAAGMCLGAAFNGAGDTWTPARLNFFCFWMGQIPLAWILANALAFGPVGVFIAMPIATSVLTLWSAALFKEGKWKQQKI
jgi:putative MATE family efflux protein